jgi:hypothetical protein
MPLLPPVIKAVWLALSFIFGVMIEHHAFVLSSFASQSGISSISF